MSGPQGAGAGSAPDTDPAEELFPPVDETATETDAPIHLVTLLEDRAQVERRARVHVAAGQTRLLVRDVAPVLRDVSLRAEISTGEARVVDTRARRAMRVRRTHKPADAAALEKRIDALATELHDLRDQRAVAQERAQTLREMLQKTLGEIPEDAGWGHVDGQTWRETLEGLMARVRELSQSALAARFVQLDRREDLERLITERQAMDRPDQHFVAWLEIDVTAETAGEVELTIEYVVPNALWRPIHSARLQGGKLRFSARAAVWQNTGEDWRDCDMVFSTARSSLGTEPPLLDDDRLRAQRRSDEVVVQARQVKVQRAQVKGGGGGGDEGATGVQLPGVDDGGDIRTLRASSKTTVPSDGRPNLVALFTFEANAERELVTMPELEEKVFEKATCDNGADAPILAGPVELVRDSGVVGWTRVLFVAPLERFELGFGPDDGARVTRRSFSEEEVDPVDEWQLRTTQVQVFVSNLAGDEKRILITERIPTSEIEHVKIDVLEEGCDPMPAVDDDGLCTWDLVLAGNGHKRIKLTWRQRTAPGVRAA